MLSKNMRGSMSSCLREKLTVTVLRKDTQETRPTLGQIRKKSFLRNARKSWKSAGRDFNERYKNNTTSLTGTQESHS